jgi:hypothetical protein
MHGGAGNAFVIIWRIGDEDTLLSLTLGGNLGTSKSPLGGANRGSNGDLASLNSGTGGSPSRMRGSVGRNSPSVDSMQSKTDTVTVAVQ